MEDSRKTRHLWTQLCQLRFPRVCTRGDANGSTKLAEKNPLDRYSNQPEKPLVCSTSRWALLPFPQTRYHSAHPSASAAGLATASASPHSCSFKMDPRRDPPFFTLFPRLEPITPPGNTGKEIVLMLWCCSPHFLWEALDVLPSSW